MPNRAEIVTAILKGMGLRPTSFLLRWSPTLKEWFRFDLVEVMRCDCDGEVVTRKLAQSPRAVHHLGHKLKSPGRYGLLTFFLLQLRVIR